MDDMEWRKASASSGQGACVEVKIRPVMVFVRDSKHPDGSYLAFTHEQWRTFLDAAKAGEFDLAVE